jgi:hypothetical protein
LEDIGQNASRKEAVEKPEFGVIEAKVLTIAMHTDFCPLREVRLVAFNNVLW